MEMNRELEPEIRLRDCLFHILYKWRSIVAVALIGALLFGGYAWWQNRNRKSESTETAAVTQTPEPDKSERNFGISNAIYNGLLDNNAQYQEESLVLQLDATRVWEATAVYAVIAEGETTGNGTMDPGIAIAQNYAAVAPAVINRKGAEAVYGAAGAREATTLMTCTAVGETANGFRLTAMGTTKEMAEDGLKCMTEGIEAFCRGSAQEMGAHHLALLSQETAEVADSALESRQAAIAKNIATYQSAIASNNKAVTTTTTTAKSTKTPKKSVLKNAVIGGAVGLLGMAAIWVLIYLLSGTIKESDILTRQYGMPVYGTLRHSRARTPGKGIDGIIEKWEFGNRAANNETVYDNIASLIPEEIQGDILLTGTIGEKKMKSLFEALEKRMSGKAGIRMEGDLIHNSRAVSEVKKAEAVLVVEEKYQSREKDIKRECEILALSDTLILGAVVI